MVNKGRLKETPFLKLLLSFYSSRVTGILRLTNGPEVKIIYLSQGKPIFSASNLPGDRMGALVLRLNIVSEDQLDGALKEVMSSGKRLGTVLVDMNLITAEQLFDLVLKQVSEIIYSAFELDDADYSFVEDVHFNNEVITLDLSLWELMIEGVKRKFSPDKLKELTGPSNTVLQKHPVSSEDISIVKDTDGERFYNLIDGNRTLTDVISAAGMGELKAIQILGVLILLGFIFPGAEKKGTATDQSLKSNIEKKLEGFQGMNLFEKLGLDKSATKEQVLTSFTLLSKSYHPDKFADPQFKDVKPLALQAYNQILEAFTILYKDATREKYIKDLQEQDKSVLFAETDPVLARQSFEKGRAFVNERKYPEAYRMFSTAITNDPNISEYYTGLAILETMNFNNHPVNIDAAEKSFSRAVELNPEEPRNYYYLGVIYKNKEEYATARGYFLKALVHNPNHRESKKQLELLDKI